MGIEAFPSDKNTTRNSKATAWRFDPGSEMQKKVFAIMSMMYKYTSQRKFCWETSKLREFQHHYISHHSHFSHITTHSPLASHMAHITHISHHTSLTSLTSLTLIFGWCVTFRGKHNLWWCRNVTFHGKRNICMVILECHFSWQGATFGDFGMSLFVAGAIYLEMLERHFSWQGPLFAAGATCGNFGA